MGNSINVEEEITSYTRGTVKIEKEDIVKAYKKLKSHVYYDNTSLFLRQKISEFENSSDLNIEDKLNNIFDKLTKSSEEVEKYFDSLVHEINVRLLPKKVEFDNEKNSSNLITNVQDSSSYNISKITYIIDMSIDAHILGVLWIMKVGYKLDRELSNNAYANRLKDENQIYGNNINLFKPYYKQYESWRDMAIKQAKYALENKKNTMIVSLDIKDYYYSADINFDKLKESLGKDGAIGDILTTFIEKVFKKYSASFKFKDIDSDNYKGQKRSIIPIGFLPSNIIGNWYLREFDESIVSNIHPLYYGRYVDDILLVIDYYDTKFKFTPNSVLKKYFIDNKILEANSVSIKYLTDALSEIYKRDNMKDKIKVFEILSKYSSCLKKKLKLDNLDSKNLEKKIKEDYNSEYKFVRSISNLVKAECEDKLKEIIVQEMPIQNVYKLLYHGDNSEKGNLYKYLYIQQEKIKVYNLSYKGSTAIIDNFVKEIRKNSSEFRYLPEEEEIINEFDEKAYSIGYSDSINKIRSVENITVDKYGASKYLAKALFINKFTGNLVNENLMLEEDISVGKVKNNIDKMCNQIISLFEQKYCIEFYSLWEKVFTYFWFNNKVDKMCKFINNIDKCIKNIQISLDKSQNFIYKYDIDKNDQSKDLIRKKLTSDIKVHMDLSLAMCFALNNEFDKEFKTLTYRNDGPLYKKIERYTLEFRKANMERHNFIFSPLYNYCRIVDDKKEINFFKDTRGCSKLNDGEDAIENACDLCKCSFELSERLKKYSPRYVHLNECILFYISKEVIKGNVVEGLEYIKDAYKLYNDINFSRNLTKDDDITLNKFYEMQILNNYSSYGKALKEEIDKLTEICIEVLIYVNKYPDECDRNNSKYIKDALKLNDLLIKEYSIETNKLYLDDNIRRYTKLILKKYFSCLSGLFKSLTETMDEELFNNNVSQQGLGDKLKYLKLTYELNSYLNKYYLNKESLNENLFINMNDIKVNKLTVSKDTKQNVRVGIAHIRINQEDIKASYLKVPNISSKRLDTIVKILNSAKRENVDMLVFPEVSLPYYFLNMLSDFSRRNDIAIIGGLEHVIYNNNKACNYLVTILPVKNEKYSSSIVKFRLKNHYAPSEIETLRGNGWTIPYNSKNYYDLFQWKGINFACYNCFELANIYDRAIFKSLVDVIIASVYNKDVEYFSNVVESVTRDIHCYFIQANSSDFGDSRISRPASKHKRDILRLKGGINNTIFVGDLNINSLREFQIIDYTLQSKDGTFKPTPPEFKPRNVKDRMGLPKP